MRVIVALLCLACTDAGPAARTGAPIVLAPTAAAGAPAPVAPPRPGRQRLGAPRSPVFRSREVTVALPRGYDLEPERRYPVVYALDGQAAFEGGLDLARAIDALQDRGLVEPHLIVAIDTTSERTRELTSDATRFGDWVFDDLKPFVDARLRSRTDAASTALVGYSYGGLAALRIFLARRGAGVGRVVCMSSSFWWRDRVVLREIDRYRGPLPMRLWLDAGTRETGRGRPYMVTDARLVRDRMLRRGARLGVDLGYLEVPGAGHGHSWGGQRAERALAFALGR